MQKKHTSNKLRTAALGLMLAVAAGAFAACGSPAASGSESSGAASATGSTAQQTAEITRGGEIVCPSASLSGEFFSPYKQGTLTNYGWPCFEPLAYYKTDGEWHPVLAESWETDDEAHTLTVKIREGVTFHNGDTLDAQDVVFSYASRNEYGTQTSIGSPSAIEAIDDYTVRFTWDDFSLNYENWILPQYIYSKDTFDEKGLDWMLNNMVGTGPYKMKSFIPDAELSFERNENYWREETPAPDSLKWIIMPDTTTTLAAFLSGEIDVYNNVTDSVVIDQMTAAGMEGVEMPFSGSTQTMAIPLSIDENDPLANEQVRQAIFHYGVDWDALAATVTGGTGYHTDAIGFTGMPYYQDSIEQGTYDPEQAVSLLAEAGYPDGFATKIYVPNTKTQSQAAAYLQAQLAEIGITADVETVDYTVIQGEYLSGKAAQSGIAIWSLSFAKDNQTDRFTKHINPTATLGGSSNWSDEIQELWARVGTATTQEEQNEYLYDYVNEYVNNGCYLWPMCNTGAGLRYTQEWCHYSDLAEVMTAGYDPFEIWIEEH